MALDHDPESFVKSRHVERASNTHDTGAVRRR
jgi:pterin-4a-carbinolamine dehydratase